ncbi:MAG: HD domain-containing protein, partial [Ktedonobacteraceae bacterium]
MEQNNIAKYVYEVGYLKHLQRAGWTMLGIPNPESVAEHSFRTAILGYILASLTEGADPLKTATMCIFHDTAEARTGDLHRLARRYHNGNADELALAEQVERLPHAIAEAITSLVQEYEQRTPLEGRLARDADMLECILQAREYQTQGFVDAEDWIKNCYAGLQSEAAKNLADACLQT